MTVRAGTASGLFVSRVRARPAAGAFAALISALLAALALGVAPSPARTEGAFRTVRPGVRLRFPDDHAAHPAYRTEWWYYTGHLVEEAAANGGGRETGFQLTFFRDGVARPRPPRASAWALRDLYFAHLAATDITGRRFLVADRLARDGPGLAGADSSRYRVWIEDWEVHLDPDGVHRLRAGQPGSHGIDLELTPQKPPALHGEAGLSRKGTREGAASYYYSLTRLVARGTVELDGETFRAGGEAWMDHEFTTGSLAPELSGWDWFGLQLDDGTEVMLYILRRADGGADPASSGSLVDRDGGVTHLERDDFAVETLRTWTSAASGATYPAAWRIAVPPAALELEVEPRLAAQELDTRSSTGIIYWEGAVSVRARPAGRPVAGRGYVELTGYAEPFRPRL